MRKERNQERGRNENLIKREVGWTQREKMKSITM
jgi:hypothetical protein